MTTRTQHLIETVQLINNIFKGNETVTRDLNSLCDTIVYTAPEIIGKRWMDIYTYCSCHFTDTENLRHFKAFNTYNSRYKEYKKLFI